MILEPEHLIVTNYDVKCVIGDLVWPRLPRDVQFEYFSLKKHSFNLLIYYPFLKKQITYIHELKFSP